MIETIPLGLTGRKTTRLGFGCAHLAGAISRKKSIEMLECAYDAGIRHFDVARMYGSGDAERCLGDFARRRRDDITITTKLGILPGRKNNLRHALQSSARALVKLAPSLRPQRETVDRLFSPSKLQRSFSVEVAERSLCQSLIALKTDRVDLLLLHEATAADLADERLLEFLQNAVTSGRIGAFGVGSDRGCVGNLVAHRPQYCSVLQYQWCALDEPPRYDRSFHIHHGAFRAALADCYTELLGDTERCRRWSDMLGSDVSNRQIFAALALKASLLVNSSSIILFASARSKHIRENCLTAADYGLNVPARRLYNLIREHVSNSIGPAPADSLSLLPSTK